MKYLRLPLDFNGITCPFKDTHSPYTSSNYHKGVDFGWHKYQGEPVYSAGDGTVLKIDKSTGTNNAGNEIWIRHSFDNKSELITRYCHLVDNTTKVKEGQAVTRGQQIASMGGTYGYATHLHYEMWKVPKGWSYNWNDRMKYLVNPLDYTFLFENQQAGTDSVKQMIKVVGTPVKRDTTKDQLEVVGYALRCRSGAGTNQAVLGYIDFGIYDYTETKVSGDYTWYHVSSGWIAGTKEDTKVYTKEEPKQDTEEELKNTITELNNKISLLYKENKELKQVIEESKKVSYKEFIAPNTAYYYINLEKGQKVLY